VAHQPKPFYRTSRNAYYVQLGKQQIKLIAGPNDPPTEKLAWAAFHKLMAEQADRPNLSDLTTSATEAQLSVAGVMDKYLGWCLLHRSPRTYEWTQKHLQSFCDHIKGIARLDALSLKPFHVVEWVDAKPTWGANQKRGAIVAVQRPFSWAAKLGYIGRNPVAGIEKPRAVRRERYVTPEEFRQLVSHYTKGDPFHDYLTFLWETGCRAQEARHIEPRHFNREFSRFDIPPPEAKGRSGGGSSA
jgi:integrase/recombinase XerC